MEAKELRIGNYCQQFLGVGDDGADYKTIEIEANDIYRISGLINHEIEPIELTEEWLEKFGFEIEKSSTHCIAFNEIGYEHELQLDKEFGTDENCWNITKYGGGYRLVYYVHQLQNLYFALTGEELTIKEQKLECSNI
ncbi:hypothetical protein [Chryseobacterium sp.]|uniref:hypothetical protein n=1 Tax=Chryseobacterium sp. TaxID=1871047 RepID=UPI00321BF3EA